MSQKSSIPQAANFVSQALMSNNSEAGHVSGRIVKVHKKNVTYKGYIHHASKDHPQYEIKSDRTDHVALHKGTALKRVGR